ncbi:hypothetical protein VaNZ11_009114 [Volvox africanus]|uniref:Uncharacterized protein n=1 Tax=Volvox africanus TaxID=51714 RepID=A0ABQ5S6K4_9CHLO|nr:hypothetical protein VaNZ11_009114 [Volvox africanus]
MGAGASSQALTRYKWTQDHTLRAPWTFIFKEKVQCACEGSKWCSRENPARQKTANAIPGLHSDWVSDKVLAMARPWQSHVEQFKLLEAFQHENIGMILNLQEVGEHANCGPGNLPHCGFTYDPETFMAAGIGYYNFSWRDMGVPSLDRMMDIVQVMDFVTRVEGRKIAVHCHAGLGRTGVAIACFFVFSGLYDSPEAAIAAVRKSRLGAVQTSSQVAFVTIFAQYLQHLRCVFPVAKHSTPPRPLPHSNSAANITDADKMAKTASGGGGKGSLETKSAPPGTLLTDGLVESRETGTAVVGVYSSGLTVTVPLPSSTSAAPPGSGGGDTLTGADLGLSRHLPWNDAFQIAPEHAADFQPRPPRSYPEALARQARLLHGFERRAFLRLHKLVKEAVFALIAAAHAFQPTTRSSTRALLSLPAILEDEQAGVIQRAKSGAAAMAAALAAAGNTGGAGGAPLAPPLPPSFAHLLSYLIAHHGPAHVDSDALTPLMAHKAYAAAVGPQVESDAVLAAALHHRHELNSGRYEGLQRAPLLVVIMLLEAFFANFSAGEEPASLTAGCLSVISQSYRDLFNGQMPAPPSRPSTADGSGNANVNENGGAGNAAATCNGSAAAAGGVPIPAISLEYARQAYEILEPLETPDSELLLVFAAMLRVVARGSGPGSEDAVVEVGKWATGLLLGKLSRVPEAEEAVLSFLWYLAGRDEAYAMLVLLKRQRIAGLPRRYKPSSGAPDIAAMLQATAASLAVAASPPSQSPPPPPAVEVSTESISTATATPATLVAPMSAGGSSTTDGGSALPSPGANGTGGIAAAAAATVVTMQALQMSQLLSQDLQQLYQVSFREALGAISTVVYPPPDAMARLNVHDVWR